MAWLSTNGSTTFLDITGGSPKPRPDGWVVALHGKWHGEALKLASPDNSFSEVFTPSGATSSTPAPRCKRQQSCSAERCARDRHCAAPGCDQPPAACQVHHIVPRSHGGATSLTNLLQLCTFHHLILVHRWGWTITLHPDGTTTATSPRGRVLHSHSPPASAA